MKTIVYIDALNLYYGCLRKSPSCKWLDLKKLISNIFPNNEIKKIKYFTANVKEKISFNSKKDLAPQRQQIYLEALKKFIPELEIYKGHFLRHRKRLPRVDNGKIIEVWKTEEKGSDVNLSVHLLQDCFEKLYDCAVIVTNDSDMAEAMRIVKECYKKKLYLVTPGIRIRTSKELQKYASVTRKIRKSCLQNSQLPDSIPDSNFIRPEEYK